MGEGAITYGRMRRTECGLPVESPPSEALTASGRKMSHDDRTGFKNLSAMRDVGVVMQNLSGFIDPEVMKKIVAEPNLVFGTHTAWDFHGYVWFDKNRFYEEVWQHKRPVKTFSSPTLSDLVQAVNDEFGFT